MNPLIAYLDALKPIPAEDEAVITAAFETKTYNENDYLFRGGRVCDETFFIIKGVVRIVSVNDKGVEVTHYFYDEDHFCTIMQSFNEETPTDTHIQACCGVEALVITKKRLHALYKRFPYIKELMERINQQQLLEKVNLRNTYVGEDAESQYKLFVMQHAAIALRVPVKDIASFLGITPQSLSRIRKNIR